MPSIEVMPRRLGTLAAICFLLSSTGFLLRLHAFTEDPNRFIRTTPPRTPEEERNGFHLPQGFEVQLFADDVQLNGKPINLAFDARGRLWVTTTQEYPFAVKKDKWSPDSTRALGSKDSIRILEDTDGDGRADKVTVFADDLNIPTGVLPYKNGCIAWSIPNILFLEDTKHEGRAEKADQRRILFGPLGYERDTHGMISSLRLGLDGWIYGTHGFSNTSHFQVLPQNKQSNPKSEILNPKSDTLDISSGSIFRFRPDGSAVQLWTNGQVNPFGLCWDSWNNLYSADCHSNPITQLIRGATYPQFGKTTDPLGFGPVMCEHAHGSTGIAGIVYIDGSLWGPEWNDHMFVGNPVTSKVNHDHITFIGSSPTANEEPDFLTSDDPWFRPVDLQLGPDNALYIADFYNKIIGHYEIPLDHPGRDRKSGRIWRVVKKGFTRKLNECDLSGKTPEQLLAIIKADSNVNTRHTACGELMRRDHLPTVPLTHQIVGPAGVPKQPEARVILEALRQMSTDSLDAPQLGDFLPFAKQLKNAAPKDEHLKHALRIALRSMLEKPGAYEVLKELKDTETMQDELIRISLAVPSQAAADWLLSQIHSAADRGHPLDHVLLGKCLGHIAGYLPFKREIELFDTVRTTYAGDLDTQLDLFFALEKGKGSLAPHDAILRMWAGQLAKQLLDLLARSDDNEWQPTTPPSKENPSPWFATKRKCADGVDAEFLDSHPPGGEKLTGALRSKAFVMPESLTFWLAGHRGFPAAAPHEKNFVRLVDAENGRELARAYPPRHDVARPVTWRCASNGGISLPKDLVGRQVYLEAVDGDSATAYAWLALGRFDPPVLGVPDLKSPRRDHRVLGLAKLCALEILPDPPRGAHDKPLVDSCLDALSALPDKATLAAETRVTLAEVESLRHRNPVARLLTPLVKDPATVSPWMNLLCDAHSDLLPALTLAFKTATTHQQVTLAELLAASKPGASALLDLAPPSVLAEPLVSSKIKALGDDTLSEHLKKITATVPPQNAAVNALIAQRLKTFDPAKADKLHGQQVFIQTCTPCHRIGVVGNLVGPQLDGIGVRGPERLLEDILDPNREVDPAFRLHILKLKDGSVTTGLIRRKQDGALIYADVAGQERSVPQTMIAGDDISPFSLMPSGFGDVLTPQQLQDLLAYLLDRR
jgi:putative heme-binding domain-containing protein